MANYTPIFEKPYPNGYEDLPLETTPVTAQTLNDKDDAIVNIETYLEENPIGGSLATLSDVDVSTVEDGQIIRYNAETEMWENADGGGGGGGSAEDITYDNTTSGMTADNVQDAIDEVFQSVSSGKVLIADAITDKGVETSADDTFQTMANNISRISGSYDSSKWEIARFQYTRYSGGVYGYTRLSNKDGTISKDNQAISTTLGNDLNMNVVGGEWCFSSNNGGVFLYGYHSGAPNVYDWFNWEIITLTTGGFIHKIPFDNFGQAICIKLL